MVDKVDEYLFPGPKSPFDVFWRDKKKTNKFIQSSRSKYTPWATIPSIQMVAMLNTVILNQNGEITSLGQNLVFFLQKVFFFRNFWKINEQQKKKKTFISSIPLTYQSRSNKIINQISFWTTRHHLTILHFKTISPGR